jgi:4,5-dihydroxyphthalate decarboxylase
VLSGNKSLEPLREGRVKIPGVELQHLPVTPIIAAFRRMCRGLEFDVCEMAVVTYFTARRYGIAMTGIPVFPLARFEHWGIVYNERAGVSTPKDLEGKSVGVRAYTVTPGVWARSFLRDEHGVDLDRVHWVLGDEEHVAQFHADAPANLEYRVGADLQKLLASGEFAGGLQLQPDEAAGVKPLYADGRAAGIAAVQRTGAYPLTHMVVIKDEVLDAHPWLARALVDAFKESKEAYREQTGASVPEVLYDDPMPIGMSATRHSLEVLMREAVAQHVLAAPLDLDELFPGNFD